MTSCHHQTIYRRRLIFFICIVVRSWRSRPTSRCHRHVQTEVFFSQHALILKLAFATGMSFLLQPFTYAFLQATIDFHTDGKQLATCCYVQTHTLHAVEVIQAPVSHVPFAFISCVSWGFWFSKRSLVGIFSLWLLHTMEVENTPLLPGLPAFLVVYTILPRLNCTCPHNVCVDIFGRLSSPSIPGVVLKRRWGLQHYCDSLPEEAFHYSEGVFLRCHALVCFRLDGEREK